MTVTRAPHSATFLRLEILRAWRNRRFLIFSVGFPVIMFYLIAGPNKDESFQGVALPAYYMAGMLAWGAMSASMAGGARIALDRANGWQRHLRITPLRMRTYFSAKILAGYALALVSILVLYVAGFTLGVRLGVAGMLETTALVLVCLMPFAVLGVLLGHLLTPDSMGPAMGGLTALLAVLGGAWGPLFTTGWGLDLVQLLPSYWLVQAGQTSLRDESLPAAAWLVIVAWTVVLALVTVAAYRRDTNRV